MNALTFRPQEAWLVVNGFKDIINSTWPSLWRGRIQIHASPIPVTTDEYERFESICRERQIESHPTRNRFQTGGIVGTVEIVDCVEWSASFWFHGPYGCVLRNARKSRFKSTKGKLICFDAGDLDAYSKKARAKPSSNDKLHAARQSLRQARSKVIADMTLAREFALMKARERKLNPQQRLQERMLFSMQCTKKEQRDLRLQPIEKVIREALKANDVRFFIKLGRVLINHPFDAAYQGRLPPKLTSFLLDHWVESKAPVPALATLTENQLVRSCRRFLNNANLTLTAVVKLRQRLGLKTIRARKS